MEVPLAVVILLSAVSAILLALVVALSAVVSCRSGRVLPSRPLGCGAESGRGICRGAKCFCADGWGGEACAMPLNAATAIEVQQQQASEP